MKQYLIRCVYDYYCQGYEETFGYFLVKASSFENACIKIGNKVANAREFENCTID